MRNITPEQLEGNADFDKQVIKGHDVYFGTFGDHFKYCAIVCADGRHLKYADEYQLHYSETRYPDKESLRKRFVEVLNGKLFTEDELREASDDYQELQAKRHYLQNYYADRREKQSIFGDAAEWYEREKEEGTLVYSRVALGFYHGYDRDFVEHMAELNRDLEAANDPLRDYEHAKNAFKYEMYNHEYAISWQGDWDVIRCFANVDGEDAEDMLPKTGWPLEIKRAYVDAAREVMDAYCG